MRKILLAALAAVPLLAGGLLYAKSLTSPTKAAGFICPITGEELPCPKCCPLNQK